MSRKTIITATVVALVALAALSSVALAGRAGCGMTGGKGMAECRMGDRGMRPSFTDEQKEEMKEIRAGFEDQRVELQNKLKVLHLEMQELTEADSPDFGKIERMIDDVGELRAQVMKLKLKQHRAIREILDDDQRVLFDRGIARMLARGAHGGRGDMRGDMKGCGSMGRGGRMSCGPAKCGPMGHRMMGAGPMGMEREMIICGPEGKEECVIMIKGDPEMMGKHMNWESEDGKRIEIFQMPDGEETEGRIIVKKIVDGDEIIIEVEEEE